MAPRRRSVAGELRANAPEGDVMECCCVVRADLPVIASASRFAALLAT
jgi:hypothetical protein